MQRAIGFLFVLVLRKGDGLGSGYLISRYLVLLYFSKRYFAVVELIKDWRRDAYAAMQSSPRRINAVPTSYDRDVIASHSWNETKKADGRNISEAHEVS
jgi:hypothetical protein